MRSIDEVPDIDFAGSDTKHSYSEVLRNLYSREKKIRKQVADSLANKFEIISDDFKRLDQKYNNHGVDILKPERNQELIQDMKREKIRKENEPFKKYL